MSMASVISILFWLFCTTFLRLIFNYVFGMPVLSYTLLYFKVLVLVKILQDVNMELCVAVLFLRFFPECQIPEQNLK